MIVDYAPSGASETRVSRATRLLERGALWLGVLALFALSFRYMDLLGDSFWSVATGRWILEHGSLPESDPFSFTANRPWIVHMPLSQVAFAWVERHFGILSLELFGALVLTPALSLLWLPHARGIRARALGFLALLLLVFVQADDLCVRGQLFGDLAFAALLICLFRLRTGQRVHPLIPLLLGSAWMNLHSSAFLAVVLPSAWATLLFFDRARPPLRPYLLFAGLAGIGLVVNPYGLRLLVDVLRLLRSQSTQRIDLFQPPDFSAPLTVLAFAWLAFVAVAAIRRPQRGEGVGLSEGLLLIAWAAVAATARRYLPLGLAFSIVVALRQVSGMWAAPAPSAQRSAWALALTIAAAGTALWGLSADKDPWRDVPVEEAALIQKLGLPDHVANIYHWGGFLDYAWSGERKTFVDGRNQLFEHGAFEDEQRLQALDHWQEILTRYRINTVLWERGSAFDDVLSQSDEWVQVSRGRIAVLYVRKHPVP